MFRLEIMWNLSCRLIWMQIGKRIRLGQHYDYFTWDCRLKNEFIYNYQGKTTNSENKTRRFSSIMSSSTITSRKKK